MATVNTSGSSSYPAQPNKLGVSERQKSSVQGETKLNRRAMFAVLGGGAAVLAAGGVGALALSGGEPSEKKAGTANTSGGSEAAPTFKEAPHNLGYFVEDWANWRMAGPKGIPSLYDNPNWIKAAKKWRDECFENTPESKKKWEANVNASFKGNAGLEARDRRVEAILFGSDFEFELLEGFEQGVLTKSGKGIRFGFKLSGRTNGKPLPKSLQEKYFIVSRARDAAATRWDPYVIISSEHVSDGEGLKQAFREWKEEESATRPNGKIASSH